MSGSNNESQSGISAGAGKLDPQKRVHYATGLVLGVDEFEQEQFYFLEQNRTHQRGLHGFGVICGLDVSLGEEGKINVSPGMAADRHGRLIQVDQAQCGDPENWLQQNGGDQYQAGDLLHVVLNYRECESDDVPVPGSPCRTQDENVAASRITSSFELSFSLTPPSLMVEQAVRDFGDQLARYQVSESQGNDPDLGEIESALVARYENWIRDPQANPLEPDNAVVWVNPGQIEALLRALLVCWVHRIKPILAMSGAVCRVDEQQDAGVSLAVLSKDPSDQWQVDYAQTPVLMSTRVNQELLLSRDAAQLWHSDLLGLDNQEDHPDYLTLDGTRPMQADLNMDGNDIHMNGATVDGLDRATADGQAMPHGQGAGGDLTGSYPDPEVDAIRGIPVRSVGNPESNQMLVYNASRSQFELRLLNLNQLGDVDTTGVQPGHMLYRQVGGWRTGGPAGDLSGSFPEPDVTGLHGRPIQFGATASDGAVITPNSAESRWDVRQLSIDELNDVDLGTGLPAENQILRWQGNAFRPANLPDNSVPTGPAGGDLSGSYPAPVVSGIGDTRVHDVDTASAGSVLVMEESMGPNQDPEVDWQPGDPEVMNRGWYARCLSIGELCDVALPDDFGNSVDPTADSVDPEADSAAADIASYGGEQMLVFSAGSWTPRPLESIMGSSDPMMGGDLSGMASDAQLVGIRNKPIYQSSQDMPGQILVLESMEDPAVSDADMGMDTSSYRWHQRCLNLMDLCDVQVGVDGAGNDAEEMILVRSGPTWVPKPINEYLAGGGDSGDASGPAHGDLSGSYPSPQVSGLQGRDVSDADPNEGDVLSWDGKQWQPESMKIMEFADLTLEFREGNDLNVEAWFHLNGSRNDERIYEMNPDMVKVSAETGSGGMGELSPMDVLDVTPIRPNVYRIKMKNNPDRNKGTLYLRFEFQVEMMRVTTDGDRSGPLLEFARAMGIRFEGYQPETRSVTCFLRVPDQ